MRIKAVIFDIDCTISKTDMLEFIAKNIGKEKEGEYWENLYHNGLKNTKTLEEKEKAAEYALKGKFSTVEGLKISELKRICSQIKAVDGAKEAFDELFSMDLKIIAISATLLPIAKFFTETYNFHIDKFITSECRTNDVVGKVTLVLTPKRKVEKLKKFLDRYNIKPEECVAVGDSVSEVPIFELIGKERSIGFNCRDSLKPFVGHIASEHEDEKRNLLTVMNIIKNVWG